MAHVVEDTEEEDEVETLVELRERVDGHAPELDAVARVQLLRRPARLAQVALVEIDGQHRCTARGELERVEARVAADVQRSSTAEVGRDVRGDLPPLEGREVAERVIRRGLFAAGQVQVVEPRTELATSGFERPHAVTLTS